MEEKVEQSGGEIRTGLQEERTEISLVEGGVMELAEFQGDDPLL